MELAFESKWLRSICESESEAEREFGLTISQVLKRRLADLRAATSTTDLIVGKPRILDNEQMIIELSDGYQVVFRANHPDNPVLESGRIDWQRVSRIKIMCIEGRHGD